MTSIDGSTYRLVIQVLKQGGSAVIGPDDVRYVEKLPVTLVRFVYDRIISHRHVYINIFCFVLALWE